MTQTWVTNIVIKYWYAIYNRYPLTYRFSIDPSNTCATNLPVCDVVNEVGGGVVRLLVANGGGGGWCQSLATLNTLTTQQNPRRSNVYLKHTYIDQVPSFSLVSLESLGAAKSLRKHS